MTQTFDHIRLIEAILFASSEPLSPERLQRHLPEGVDLDEIIGQLQQLYANRGVNLVRVGKNWAFRTASDLSPYMQVQTTAKRKPNRAGRWTCFLKSGGCGRAVAGEHRDAR